MIFASPTNCRADTKTDDGVEFTHLIESTINQIKTKKGNMLIPSSSTEINTD